VKPFARGGIAMVALALGACATQQPLPERAASGRFTAMAVSADKRESLSGRFTLEVRGAQQVIDIATPVGTTVARIQIEPGSATATGPQLQVVRGPDADDLIEQVLGWPLPVSGLSDWLEGRPSPSRPARTQRSGERVSEIEQDGWIIRIAEYSAVTARPRVITLDRSAQGTHPGVSVRLIVDDPTP
jgi:outer membrane lipoprotein LolB